MRWPGGEELHRGYVKLWRKSIDGGWLQDHYLWTIWCWILMKATHKPIKIIVGLKEVNLEKGEFVFGLKKASEELKMPLQKIRSRLSFLQETKNISVKSTNKFSIISVINWDIYQSEDTPDNKPLTFNQQTTNIQLTTNKHKNNKKNSTSLVPSEAREMAELLLNLIQERNPGFKVPDLGKWSVEIDRMVRVDHRGYQEIEDVIRWSQQDSFWQNNILSASKLRKQFDQLSMRMGTCKGERVVDIDQLRRGNGNVGHAQDSSEGW